MTHFRAYIYVSTNTCKMFHGGTNFALGSGSIWKNKTSAFTTSYDYGSPLDESGRTTDYYFTLRDTIKKYSNRSLPEPPANVPLLSIPEFQLVPRIRLWDTTTTSTLGDFPSTMEELGQDYGFVLYEHKVTQTMSGLLQPGDRPRDRVIVYVNEARIGVIDSICTFKLASFVMLCPVPRPMSRNSHYQPPISSQKNNKAVWASREVADRPKTSTR